MVDLVTIMVLFCNNIISNIHLPTRAMYRYVVQYKCTNYLGILEVVTLTHLAIQRPVSSNLARLYTDPSSAILRYHQNVE